MSSKERMLAGKSPTMAEEVYEIDVTEKEMRMKEVLENKVVVTISCWWDNKFGHMVAEER